MKKMIFAWAVFFAIAIYSAGLLQFAENKNSAEGYTPAEQTQSVLKYTVKEHNGKIAVFVGNEPIPVKYLEIDIQNLREYDKNQFKTGITLNSLTEVLMLEEDFSS